MISEKIIIEITNTYNKKITKKELNKIQNLIFKEFTEYYINVYKEV